jgi:hypothetical protein
MLDESQVDLQVGGGVAVVGLEPGLPAPATPSPPASTAKLGTGSTPSSAATWLKPAV